MADHETEEEKKKKRKKRLKDMFLHLYAQRMNKQVDIDAPSAKDVVKKPEKLGRSAKNEDATKKLATVQKSIELRRREARERWNRYAGTSDAGAMGR